MHKVLFARCTNIQRHAAVVSMFRLLRAIVWSGEVPRTGFGQLGLPTVIFSSTSCISFRRRASAAASASSCLASSCATPSPIVLLFCFLTSLDPAFFLTLRVGVGICACSSRLYQTNKASKRSPVRCLKSVEKKNNTNWGLSILLFRGQSQG